MTSLQSNAPGNFKGGGYSLRRCAGRITSGESKEKNQGYSPTAACFEEWRRGRNSRCQRSPRKPRPSKKKKGDCCGEKLIRHALAEGERLPWGGKADRSRKFFRGGKKPAVMGRTVLRGTGGKENEKEGGGKSTQHLETGGCRVCYFTGDSPYPPFREYSSIYKVTIKKTGGQKATDWPV